MRSTFPLAALTALPLTALAFACGSDGGGTTPGAAASADAAPPEPTCPAEVAARRFPAGNPDGHADPFGAKAARQARAGKLRDLSAVRRPDDARNRLMPGDFALANDKIVALIEGARPSDGYNPFGGEINAVEAVADDGRPSGVSQYGETVFALSRQVLAPESVTVLADGSDGKAAIVRAVGRLKNLPTIFEPFRGIFPDEYDFPAAVDYVLEPGSSKVTVRLSFVNTRPEELSFAGKQLFGLFHTYRSQLYTERFGYAEPTGKHAYVGFDGERTSFAIAQPGQQLEAALAVSGFRLFQGAGLTAGACATVETDYVEITVGGPELDGLARALRGGRAESDLKGVVEVDDGTKAASALVVALGEGGKVVARTRADKDGAYTLHAPAGAPVTLHAYAAGYAPSAGVAATPGASAKLVLARGGTIAVAAKDATTGEGLPVRVQIIPASAVPAPPAEWGAPRDPDGRLVQALPADGVARIAVPPGSHRVVVSRGYEYELFDQVVTAEAGKVTDVPVSLARSVDSTGVMCADFHIHSNFSVDATDTVEEKVRASIAEGLELPISSEHDWIIDFRPVIQRLGLSKWATSFPSLELTTFSYGHFGVVPATPNPDAPNRGAVDWVGKTPPDIFKAVRALPGAPALIVNHPNSTAFEGYFSSTSYDEAKAKGRDGIWSDDFDALEVFRDQSWEQSYERNVKSWFSQLDTGRNVFAVGSSDSHRWRGTPVGYPRTCLRFGHDDPARVTGEAVRDLIKSGAATISGGLYMTVEGPGGVAPGGKGKAGPYKVVVQGPSWVDATELEVFVDGQSVKTQPLVASAVPGPGKRYEATIDVAAAASRPRHYVVFAAKGKRDLAPLHPRHFPFAASNPIFFE